MAKIHYILLGILLLCYSCSNSVSQTSVASQDSTLSKQTAKVTDSLPSVGAISADSSYVDSSIKDEPVIVDTTVEMPTATKIIKETPAILKQKSIQEIYTAYIGVREATGHNDGKEVEYFLSNVGLGKGFPWCAAFVKTCLLESGNKSATAINGMASSCNNLKYPIFSSHKMLGDIHSGDVFTLYFPRLKRIGHTGFVDLMINTSVVQTVEGNTNEAGSREGDGVYKKKRGINSIYTISRWQ